jgi:IS605 OrfB family transposase
MATEMRAIKFYSNSKTSTEDFDKGINFLTECREVENKLLEYYWNNFNEVIRVRTWIDFYSNRIMITSPATKFQHYMQILSMTYGALKSLQENIIQKIHFKFEDKMQQRIYNYCSKFVFDWDRLVTYINKQVKEYKKKDKKYHEFLLEVKKVIDNEQSFLILQQDIEDKFWELKNKINLPIKKSKQIWANTFHTVDIEKYDDYWIFIIDTNKFITKRKMENFRIVVDISDYHKKILDKYTLQNTFTIKFNNYDRFEIIGAYEKEINHPTPNPVDIIGIDIGLKKLITSSDGEIVEQNKTIVKKAQKLIKNQANRQSLEAHMRKKLDDEKFTLPDKNYKKKQNKLSRFVQCDNCYRIKQFLKGKEDTHIIMEDLQLNDAKTYSKEVNYMLRRMKIQGIKNDILKYTKEMGIKTTQVNPRYTSIDCPICGNRDKLNRQTQETFKCTKCGHTDNADHNASINIENRFLKAQ